MSALIAKSTLAILVGAIGTYLLVVPFAGAFGLRTLYCLVDRRGVRASELWSRIRAVDWSGVTSVLVGNIDAGERPSALIRSESAPDLLVHSTSFQGDDWLAFVDALDYYARQRHAPIVVSPTVAPSLEAYRNDTPRPF